MKNITSRITITTMQTIKIINSPIFDFSADQEDYPTL